MTVIAPPPGDDSIVETDETRPDRRDPFPMGLAWLRWIYESLIPRLQLSSTVLLTPESVGGRIENRSASIATTPLPIAELEAGTYRVSYNARKTTIDGGGLSPLTITLGWTDGTDSSAQILSGPAMATDSTTSPQSGSIVVSIAGASALTYATVVGAGSGLMRYKVEFSVESLTS